MAFPTVTTRIAFATAPFAAVPTWTDVSSLVREIRLRRGRQHELDRVEASIATIVLDNSSADWWPDNAAGVWYPNVLPGKRVNVRAVYNSITYDLFTGFVEAYDFAFAGGTDKIPIVTITAVDLLKALAILLLNDGGGYAQQRSDLRVGEVLDDLAWPAGARDLNTGQSTLIATGALANVNALGHLDTVQQSELGIVFAAGDGDVQFQDRHTRLKTPYLVASATFGDDPGEMGYHAVELAYDDSQIYNDVRITRSGGTEQVASDATSQTTYGKRSLERSDLLMTTDGEALDQASYLLARYKAPALRVQSLTIRPQSDEANLFPKVLSYDLSTRITVRLNAASIDADYYVEGVQHEIAPLAWQTRWELSDADAQEYWILGTSQLGTGTRLAY